MKLHEILILFKELNNKTDDKAESKIYSRFISIISELNQRELSEEELNSIENQLDSLNNQSEYKNKRKFYKAELNKFEKLLRDNLYLVSKDYYKKLGIALGSSFGILFGIVFLSNLDRSLGISLGISLGMLIGLLFGRNKDLKAEQEGRVI